MAINLDLTMDFESRKKINDSLKALQTLLAKFQERFKNRPA